MTDSHAQLEAWLVDGAMADPPREIAVHATLCESCTARLAAFDALALIDVGAAGSPPPPAQPSRARVAMGWARLAAAVAGTVVAGILIVFGVSQLVGSGGPAGEPEGTELAGVGTASEGPAGSQRGPSSVGPGAAQTPTSSVPATAQPGFTPGPLPSLLPGATPRPSIPLPSASPGPTPTPVPTPDLTPIETPSPEPSASPTPTPTPTPELTPSPSP